MTDKKTILITGANRGIGLALVKEALSNDLFVIACSRNDNNNQDLNFLKCDNLHLFKVDVTDEFSIKKMGKAIDKNIDFLVCNAGINNGYGSFNSDDHSKEKMLDVFNVNVIGPILTVRNVMHRINKGGNIIFISSIMGVQKHDGSRATIYRASKAAVNNVMISMSNDFKSNGITVTAFHPGWVRTDMGGPNATLSVKESASYLISNFLKLNINDSGHLFNYDGTKMEF